MNKDTDLHTAPPADGASSSDRLLIFDTTLRDGTHSPLITFTEAEKLAIADALRDICADVVEIGVPDASPEEFRLAGRICAILRETTVAVLARPDRQAIERAFEATVGADRVRLHTFISTSPQQMQAHGLHPDAVLEAISQSVTFARRHTDDVEWSSEDGSRSGLDFLSRCVETAIRAGATTINIPDSAGWIMPDEYGLLIGQLRARVPGADEVVFSVHCHDDMGLALANTLAGIRGGARQVECTLRGLGARAGNTAIGELLHMMTARPDVLPFDNSINHAAVAKAEAMVSAMISRRS